MPYNKRGAMKEMTIINKIKQRGAVSLFIVVFAALLITVVSVGFVSIMVQDQQQASTTDLSQSAYDSAQAGVEDAKRALVRYQSVCNSNSGSDCAAARKKISSAICNEAVETLTDVAAAVSSGEVKVQTGGSNKLNQAYTCVKVILDTADYLGKLAANEYNLVPLTSTSLFDTIQVQWFSSDDLEAKVKSQINLLSPAAAAKVPLLAQSSWLTNRPPIMRAQLIQFGSSGFTLNDFDNKISAGMSNANTLFLYPGKTGINTKSFADDIRKTPTGSPTPVTCSDNLSAGGYSCTTKLKLPKPIGGGNDRTAYIRLGALYNGTSYRVTLLNGDTPVLFNAVQPMVDSTGRANDLFRRIQSRVELIDANFPYPVAAIDTAGNFCKEFIITDNVDDYRAGNCTP